MFDRAIVPIGTASAGRSSTRLYYYRTNYGKIKSIRDGLFQLTKLGRIFASFDPLGWRLDTPRMPLHAEIKSN